jgi:Ser/Thr protein kinase RdoA (MazF antagonist)
VSLVLGRHLAEGRTADVFELGALRVVKLVKPGFSEDALRSEADKTRAAVAAGAPAPWVHGVGAFQGRLGIVFDRVDGETMVERILESPDRGAGWGEELARIHAGILNLESDQLPDVKTRLAARIEGARLLSSELRGRTLETLASLPAGSAILHGDFHPMNILVDDNRTVVIDWVDASRGPAAADVARTLWLLSIHAVPAEFPGRDGLEPTVEALRTAYLAKVIELTGVTRDEIGTWQLPVLAARLSEEIEHEVEPLQRAIVVVD